MSEEMTNEQIEAAYETVKRVEQKLLEDLVAFATDTSAKLKSIKDAQPVSGSTSQARQFLSRVENALNQVFTYDLQNVQSMYGVNNVANNSPIYTPVS